MLALFTNYHAVSMDDIGDGHVAIRSVTFQERFDKHSIDGNGE